MVRSGVSDGAIRLDNGSVAVGMMPIFTGDAVALKSGLSKGLSRIVI